MNHDLLSKMCVVLQEQLMLRSKTKHFSKGSIIADSHEEAKGLIVITAGQVGVELPMDSAEADEENRKEDGKTLLYVLKRGCEREQAALILMKFLNSSSELNTAIFEISFSVGILLERELWSATQDGLERMAYLLISLLGVTVQLR